MFDFSVPNVPCSDGILLMKGTHLQVSKAYIALYSPVFSSLFFSDFRESKPQEVAIENVELGEFEELLQVIYPSHKPITAVNE